jgi:hypothetical protein
MKTITYYRAGLVHPVKYWARSRRPCSIRWWRVLPGPFAECSWFSPPRPPVDSHHERVPSEHNNLLVLFIGQITFSNQTYKKSPRAEGRCEIVRSLGCKM